MPVEKLILAHLTGKRTKSNALKIIYQLKKRSNANANNETLFITSDGNDDYTDAIQSAYGDLNSGTGELEMPATLCYAQVVKTIEKGKCTAVKRKLVLESEDLLKRCLSNAATWRCVSTIIEWSAKIELRFIQLLQWLHKSQTHHGSLA